MQSDLEEFRRLSAPPKKIHRDFFVLNPGRKELCALLEHLTRVQLDRAVLGSLEAAVRDRAGTSSPKSAPRLWEQQSAVRWRGASLALPHPTGLLL